MANELKTTEPVQPGNFTDVMPEFGRTADLQKHFGIRRGTAYNLLAAGKIRGVLLRVKGKKSGCRLFDMGSVRDLLRREMESARRKAP
jgi:hypothetical protein